MNCEKAALDIKPNGSIKGESFKTSISRMKHDYSKLSPSDKSRMAACVVNIEEADLNPILKMVRNLPFLSESLLCSPQTLTVFALGRLEEGRHRLQTRGQANHWCLLRDQHQTYPQTQGRQGHWRQRRKDHGQEEKGSCCCRSLFLFISKREHPSPQEEDKGHSGSRG